MKKSILLIIGCILVAAVVHGQSITVTSPNGGEFWAIGATHTINWSSSGISGAVKIGLFKETVHLGNIAEHQDYQTGVSWHVGDPLLNGATYGSGTDYKIQVQSEVDWHWKDQSDGYFSIGTPGISVTSPNGGEEWVLGTTHTITWVSEGVSCPVKIGLFKGDIHLGNIAEHRDPLTSFSWHVGDPLLNGVTYGRGSDYKIQVQSECEWTIKDQSDDYFVIKTSGTTTIPRYDFELFPDCLKCPFIDIRDILEKFGIGPINPFDPPKPDPGPDPFPHGRLVLMHNGKNVADLGILGQDGKLRQDGKLLGEKVKVKFAAGDLAAIGLGVRRFNVVVLDPKGVILKSQSITLELQ